MKKQVQVIMGAGGYYVPLASPIDGATGPVVIVRGKKCVDVTAAHKVECALAIQRAISESRTRMAKRILNSAAGVKSRQLPGVQCKPGRVQFSTWPLAELKLSDRKPMVWIG